MILKELNIGLIGLEMAILDRYKTNPLLDMIELFEGIRYFSKQSLKDFIFNIPKKEMEYILMCNSAMFSQGTYNAVEKWCKGHNIKCPKDKDKMLSNEQIFVKYTTKFHDSGIKIYNNLQEKTLECYIEYANS